MRTPSVVAYFGDDPDRVYQLEQWLPVLELLDTSEPVAVVLRQEDTGAVVRALTDLPVLVAEDFAELRELYAELDAKVVLYCNNSMRNFQSLLEPLMLHVHINHGESDKQSMASNNAKSYDRVFVAGDAAVQRIERGLLEFDTSQAGPDRAPAARPAPRARARAQRAAHPALRPDVGGRRRLQQLLLGRPVRARDRTPAAGRARRTRGLQAAPADRDQRGPGRARGAPRDHRAARGRTASTSPCPTRTSSR